MGSPVKPSLLLQLIKTLKHKEGLIEQARKHNDALDGLRARERGETAASGAAASSVLELQKEHAWCVVQIDRANHQLREALWSVAQGSKGEKEKTLSGVHAMAEASSAAGRDESGRSRNESGGEDALAQCQNFAKVLMNAVIGVDGEEGTFEGTEAVQPLVSQCLHLLMLLRLYEERSALAARSGGSIGKDWDAAFDEVLSNLRSQQGGSDPAREALLGEIVQNVDAYRQALTSS